MPVYYCTDISRRTKHADRQIIEESVTEYDSWVPLMLHAWVQNASLQRTVHRFTPVIISTTVNFKLRLRRLLLLSLSELSRFYSRKGDLLLNTLATRCSRVLAYRSTVTFGNPVTSRTGPLLHWDKHLVTQPPETSRLTAYTYSVNCCCQNCFRCELVTQGPKLATSEHESSDRST